MSAPARTSELATSTRLLLIRHGKADCNENGVIGGPIGCTGLSDLGRRQAAALHDRLVAAGQQVDVVLTSVLPRAIETAAILAPAIGAPVAEDCDLCELHPGEADGMTWGQWTDAYGFDLRTEIDRPLSPGGESMLAFAVRTRSAIERVAAEHHGQSVALVVHGGFIAATTLHLLGFDEHLLGKMAADSERQNKGMWLEPENTSITEWEQAESGRWTMHRFGDAAHLETL